MVPAAPWLWVWCCLQHLPTNTPLLVSRETGTVPPGRWGSVGPTPLTVCRSVCLYVGGMQQFQLHLHG